MTPKRMMMFGMSFLIAAMLSMRFLPESLDGLKGLLMGVSIGCNLMSVVLKSVTNRTSCRR
ncbi:MAG TPA: hypothetical protein VII75_05835 [Thermoanaerobaculia bacterium]